MPVALSQMANRKPEHSQQTVGANFPMSEKDERASQVFAGNEKSWENEIQAAFPNSPAGNREEVKLYNLTTGSLVISLVWCNLEIEFL